MKNSKYFQIYSNLLDGIEKEVYKANSLLPSEKELMEMYNASRDTVRKSLDLLRQNGYIAKNKGKGSVVLDYRKIAFPVSGLISFKELAATMGQTSSTKVVELNTISLDDELKQKLYMEDGDVTYVKRVRTIDNERVILDVDYINASIVPDIDVQIAENSLYEYIEKDLNLKVGFSRKEFTVKPATSEDFELLDMHNYDMVVSVVSYTYLEDATLFQYTEARHRPDKFRFVEFARRSHQ